VTDNTEAEASRTSAEKERHTVVQTERQEAQIEQQAILRDIHSVLDCITKPVTGIKATQQRDWKTQVH